MCIMPYKDDLNRSCGFIDVEEKEKSSKFVKRFLRLDKPSGVVEWFADDPSHLPKNSKPLGTIDVNFITKVDAAAKVKFKARHCFVVNTPMRRYYFQAYDEADMENWVETLNNASMIVVPDDENENTTAASNNGSLRSPRKMEEYSYKTEIVAGVVVQKKMEPEENLKDEKQEDIRPSSVIQNGSPNKNLSRSPVKMVKQGWAVKQGHLRKNWKRRFFKLSTAGFSYFKSDQDKEPIRFIPISEVLASKKDQTMLSQYKDNLFFVATTERIYYIQADSSEEMHDWIKCFHDALHFSGSLKLRSKANQPILTGEKSSASSRMKTTAKPRKLEATLSVASPLRNSAFLVNPNAHGYSPSSHRLSSADEAFYRSLTPYKSLSDVQTVTTRQRRVASTSEESLGLGSSIDSVTATGTDTVPDQSRQMQTKKKVLRHTCSGDEILPVELKQKSSKATERKGRRSLPSSVGSRVGAQEEITSSASFSGPIGGGARHSGSFTTPAARLSKSFYLDPKVDHRAAVKPSTVKKKRNPGILFSLNNMLNKKAEKMSSAEKKRRGL